MLDVNVIVIFFQESVKALHIILLRLRERGHALQFPLQREREGRTLEINSAIAPLRTALISRLPLSNIYGVCMGEISCIGSFLSVGSCAR